jgi:hypothetical protein
MPRPKSPDGKRIPMTTRFSEPEAAEIDAARGNTDRSEWLREAALAAARASGRKPLPTDVITIISDERMPPGVVGVVSRGRDTVAVSGFSIGAEQAEPEPCPHPKARVIKGFCYACGKPAG